MRKKILALVMAVLTAIMMIGCNKTGISLLDEMQKIYNWEAIDSKADFKVEATIEDKVFKLSGDITSYMDIANKAMEGKIILRSMETEGITVDLTKGEYKIEPVKVIYKDGNTYINKAYINDIFKYVDTTPSKSWNNISSEYIGLKDSATDISKEAMSKYIDLMKNINTDFKVTQDNRTYTVEIADSNFTKVISEFMTQLFKSDAFKESMLAVGEITEEEYTDFQQEMEKQINEMLPEIEAALKGSNAKAQYTFTDESCKESGEVNLVINGDESKTNIKLVMTAESKKAAVREINVPADTKVYTSEELSKIVVPSRAYIYQDELISKKDATYVPLRDVMEQLDIPMSYNSKNKTTTVNIDGKKIQVKTKVMKNTSYITLAELKGLGLTYSKDEDCIVIERAE